MRAIDPKKYLLVFVITAAIFGTALYLSNFLNNRRLAEIRAIESKIAVDILSSETQFSLLAESVCADVSDSFLSRELNSLAEKLSYMEDRFGADNAEVVSLKRYYSILQIKDYLLMKKVSAECGTKPVTILYFYSNAGDCEDCGKAGIVLTHLREEYPKLRIYAFDYNLDLSALKTLTAVLNIENNLPALVINGKTQYGFQELEKITKSIPNIEELRMATTTENAASPLERTEASQ